MKVEELQGLATLLLLYISNYSTHSEGEKMAGTIPDDSA